MDFNILCLQIEEVVKKLGEDIEEREKVKDRCTTSCDNSSAFLSGV